MFPVTYPNPNLPADSSAQQIERRVSYLVGLSNESLKSKLCLPNDAHFKVTVQDDVAKHNQDMRCKKISLTLPTPVQVLGATTTLLKEVVVQEPSVPHPVAKELLETQILDLLLDREDKKTDLVSLVYKENQNVYLWLNQDGTVRLELERKWEAVAADCGQVVREALEMGGVTVSTRFKGFLAYRVTRLVRKGVDLVYSVFRKNPVPFEEPAAGDEPWTLVD